MPEIYPWHKAQWRQLAALRAEGKLPHGLLLSGQRGLGLNRFAMMLAQSLVCQASDETGLACGQCAPCLLFNAGTHPDFLAVHVEDEKTQISIDQIRELQNFIQLSHSTTGYKVAVVYPADAMNINASNSLLKSLEEPPGDTVLILVAHQVNRLPATIRSRCQQTSFPCPESDIARTWLNRQGYTDVEDLLLMAHGAPCLAVELEEIAGRQAYQQVLNGLLELLAGRQRIAALVEQWSQIPAELLVQWQLGMLRDLIRAASGLENPRFENQSRVQALHNRGSQVNLEQLFNVYDQLVDLYRHVDAPLNPELLRERMILFWTYWLRPELNR